VVSHSARVLVVDDEPAIRALIAKIVERAGFPVDIARDGEEAIQMLGQALYDVLVIDLMMPNIDGYDVVNHLRDRGGPRPAIIVITAGDSSAIRLLDGSIVHSVVRKPFDIDVLADLIGAAAQTMEKEREKSHTDGSVVKFPERRVC
jgi:CheY-like chemotaxis protein